MTLQALSSKALNKQCNTAGLLTRSGHRSRPIGFNRGKGYSITFLAELTAAGLFGTYTRFPFNLCKERTVCDCKDSAFHEINKIPDNSFVLSQNQNGEKIYSNAVLRK